MILLISILKNGESQTVSISEMEGMVSGSGNTFIGYIK